uniref:NPH3 domain-containing protein n=1 Tax=Heterorhabditis bacteriophora TaxID=37862 RepID=A0A1I7WJ53_HETBA
MIYQNEKDPYMLRYLRLEMFYNKMRSCPISDLEVGWYIRIVEFLVDLYMAHFPLCLESIVSFIRYSGTSRDAIRVTRERKIDLNERGTDRKVFQCLVVGAKDSGKIRAKISITKRNIFLF